MKKSKIRTIKITVKETKGETKFFFCGNGKKTLIQADALRESGGSIDDLNTPQKAFMSMIHTLYTSGFVVDMEE